MKDFWPKIKFEPYISFINITLKYLNPEEVEAQTNEKVESNIKYSSLDDKKST